MLYIYNNKVEVKNVQGIKVLRVKIEYSNFKSGLFILILNLNIIFTYYINKISSSAFCIVSSIPFFFFTFRYINKINLNYIEVLY